MHMGEEKKGLGEMDYENEKSWIGATGLITRSFTSPVTA